MTAQTASTAQTPADAAAQRRKGIALVAGAALAWSFGGAIARFLHIDDPWTIVFWRSTWAATFLLGFMLARDGAAGTRALVFGMRWPAILVATCFAVASTSFIVALQHTTVANILLMQAGTPLIAALIARIAFGEKVDLPTWLAIAAVIGGVSVMVSDSFSSTVSPLGDALALLITVVFAFATVLTRHYAHVRMTPAVFLGTAMAGAIAAIMGGAQFVPLREMALLFVFGAFNLGLGMVFFATGARLIPAALSALISTAEPVFGPVWVWLIHSEVPAARTLAGGLVVLAALIAHILWQATRRKPPSNPPLPH
jgi:drug/metabolite transporter (DMT)-like permease